MDFGYKNIIQSTTGNCCISEISSPSKITSNIAVSLGISCNTMAFIVISSSSFLCPFPITATIQFGYKNVRTSTTGKVCSPEISSPSSDKITSNKAVSRGISCNTKAAIVARPSSFFCPEPIAATIQFGYKNVCLSVCLSTTGKSGTSERSSPSKITCNIAVS